MASEQYYVSLNYEGIDYNVAVDSLETAGLLINDPEASATFMRKLLAEEAQSHEAAGNSLTELFVSSEKCSETETFDIWSLKKPNATDKEATLLLLQLRKEKNKLFADKMTRKTKLWNDIAAILTSKGYRLGHNGGEKCRQKFTNLQKAYLKYITNQKTTGSEKMEIPPYFDELQEILGDKHKINPVALEDSINIVDSKQNTDVFQSGPSCSSKQNTEDVQPHPGTSKQNTKEKKCLAEADIINRFSKPRPSKPSKTSDFVQEMQEDRKKRAEEFDFLKAHLKKSEEQRDRLLNILEKSLKGKKRKYSESDSE